MKVFVDTDILIWYLRGKERAKNVIKHIFEEPAYEPWIGAMQRAEIVFFMRKHEEKQTLAFLSLFRTHPVNEQIIDQAGVFYRKWNPSHGTDPNDAILAATVALYGGKILSQNISHYPMPEVSVERGW